MIHLYLLEINVYATHMFFPRYQWKRPNLQRLLRNYFFIILLFDKVFCGKNSDNFSTHKLLSSY
jgi:hypothetical protein